MTTTLHTTATTAAAVAAVLALTAAPAFIPSPAGGVERSILGASLDHDSPDDGYDPAIIARMADCGEVRIKEGQRSDDLCDSESVTDAYVRPGEEIWCWIAWRGGGFWEKRFDKTGWHSVAPVFNRWCILRKD